MEASGEGKLSDSAAVEEKGVVKGGCEGEWESRTGQQKESIWVVKKGDRTRVKETVEGDREEVDC